MWPQNAKGLRPIFGYASRILLQLQKFVSARFRRIVSKIPVGQEATWALVLITLLSNIGMLCIYLEQTANMKESNRMTQSAVEITGQSLELSKETFYQQWRPYMHLELDSFAVNLFVRLPDKTRRQLDTLYIESKGKLKSCNIDMGAQFLSTAKNDSKQPIIIRATIAGMITQGGWEDKCLKSIEALFDSTIHSEPITRNDVDVVILPDSTDHRPRLFTYGIDWPEFRDHIERDTAYCVYVFQFIEYQDIFNNVYNVAVLMHAKFEFDRVGDKLIAKQGYLTGIEKYVCDIGRKRQPTNINSQKSR